MVKHLRSVAASLFFGSLVLLSCADKNPTASISDTNQNEVGQAIVRLPDLSSHQLQKMPAGVTDSNALTLLIVAADMDTIKYSWPVASLKGQQVVIEGIPAGKNRIFEGFLTARGSVTHSGKVAVQILAGQQVPVTLKLTGTGSADVCIEIEGYPSSCNQNDTFFISSCLNGATPQNQVTGNFKIYIYGTYAYGTFTFFGIRPETTTFYDISGPIKIQNSSDYRLCQTTALERTTKAPHIINFTINNNSELSSGYIVKDSLPYGATVVKFYSVSCSTPDTTISVSTCLNGYTPTNRLFGKITMTSNGKSISGSFTLNNMEDSSTFGIYYFEKLVQQQGSVCQSIVVNKLTGTRHFLNMTVVNSKITYSYLSRDTLLQSEAIAKFFSAECGTPDTDSISVSTCLSGTTPTNKLSGKITMVANSKFVSGSFTLNNIEDGSLFGVYYFEKLVLLQDSICRAIVVNKEKSTRHLLNMTIVNSKITYSFLSRDTLQLIDAIAKFISVECSTPPPADTAIKVYFEGVGTYPDTSKFGATMAIRVSQGKAVGDFYFHNCPLIKPAQISVSGIYQKLSDSTSGYMSLTSTDTSACYYAIAIKFAKGFYSGVITQKGTCGTKTIADIMTPKGTY